VHAEEVDASLIIDAAFKEMMRLDSLCGYKEQSDVSRVNRNSGRSVPVSRDVAAVVSKSIEYSRISNGALDITIDPVSRLWHRFEGETFSVPLEKSIRSALALVDYRRVTVKDSLVKLSTRGGSIDLGATAKGYAVDRGIAVLESLGAAGGLIDAGGDIRAFGRRPDGGFWRIGVRNPRVPDSIVTVLEVDARSIATSGDYERYFIKDGVRYHHILDPSTGFPARGCCSVTIIMDKALDADAIATAVFVMGPQDGMKLIESLPDVEGLIIVCDDHKKEILRSKGLVKYEKRN